MPGATADRRYDPIRRSAGHEGLCPQSHVLFLQRGDNRKSFVADEDAYCARYGLNQAQRNAIRHRNVLELMAAGGNIYYLAKFAGIFGLSVQDLGAQQTGMTVEQFKAKLVQAGK